jgi:CpeT/CpcT family (DUF1001)
MAERSERRSAARLAAVAVCGAVLLAACAAQKAEKQRDTDLTELLGWLAGTYDNVTQADSDARQGIRPPHDRLQLVVVAIPAVRLGHHAFYVQEMAADNPQRVMSERFWSFKNDEDKRAIIQTIYTPKEPVRWRDGQNNPDVFTGVVIEDVDTTPGCEITWKKVGTTFQGSNDPAKCHVPNVARVEMTFELSVDTLNMADVETDASGRVVHGAYYDRYTRFRKSK